jgi:hypothetical protein
MKAEAHPTPSPKLPEHLSTDTAPRGKEEKIDKQVQDSFPASDPPSYSGGNHIIGAPQHRERDAAAANDQAVKSAEQKVKDGSAQDNRKY